MSPESSIFTTLEEDSISTRITDSDVESTDVTQDVQSDSAAPVDSVTTPAAVEFDKTDAPVTELPEESISGTETVDSTFAPSIDEETESSTVTEKTSAVVPEKTTPSVSTGATDSVDTDVTEAPIEVVSESETATSVPEGEQITTSPEDETSDPGSVDFESTTSVFEEEEIATTSEPITESPDSSCIFNGEYFAHGAEIPDDDVCQVCHCDAGKIICAILECLPPSDNCTVLQRDLRECCPRYECGKTTV